jgi:hypothetical protein
LMLPFWPADTFGGPGTASHSAQEQFRLGERMYRAGILPSGKAMKTLVNGEPALPGMAFSCESCHLRSGLGSFVDGNFTPPINGAKLFRPQQRYSSVTGSNKPFKPVRVDPQSLKYYRELRPVYTEETLARALGSGVDCAGRKMNDVMPRYLLEKEDLQLLIAYLKKLSSEFSPGVTETTIRFATIITEDVSPEEQNAMLIPLETYLRNRNQTNFLDPREGVRSRSTGFRSRVMAETTLSTREAATRKLSLSRWVLKGPAETWRNQLEEYYRKEPVFAILGGITGGTWQPVHQFCEEHRLPGLFPNTDFPVISQTDWYTLYLSKGFYQEGEGAAVFLNDKEEVKGRKVVQVVRATPEGRALSRGFQEAWRDFGQEAPVTVSLEKGAGVTAEFLQKKLTEEKPAAVLLWDDAETFKTLELLAAQEYRPPLVLVSSGFLGKSMFSLDEKLWPFTYLTYPYGISQLPGERNPSSMAGLKKFDARSNAVATTRISQRSYLLVTILDMALTEMRGNYYRDNLLDAIGTIMDQDVQLYDHIGFGPGQRYASKGCYIVQVAKSGLVKRSGWLLR